MKNIYINIFAVSLAFSLLTPFQLNAAIAYQKGIKTIEFTGRCSDNRPREKKVHLQAIESAKKAAWNNYVAKFSAEKMTNYMKNENNFTSEIDKYITEYVILETECSKSQRTYTVALKASINQTLVDVTLNQLSGDQGKSSELKGQFVVSMVIARKVLESKSFDARKTTQKETVKSIDADEDAISDGSSSSFSGQTTEREKITTGGSTVRKAEQRVYDIGDQKNAEVAIEQAFLRANMRLIKPSRVEKMSGRLFMEQVRNEYSGLSDSGNANLSDNTFEEVVEAIIDIGRVKYLITGTMDTSAPRDDPDTGLKKVDVYITMELSRIDDFFGAEKIALVGPELRSGLHETESGAEIAALKLAANDATDILLNRLSN
jgi:hypothetical protein